MHECNFPAETPNIFKQRLQVIGGKIAKMGVKKWRKMFTNRGKIINMQIKVLNIKLNKQNI